MVDLGVGDWSDWWLDVFEIDDASVEGYVRMKLITLTPTADAFGAVRSADLAPGRVHRSCGNRAGDR